MDIGNSKGHRNERARAGAQKFSETWAQGFGNPSGEKKYPRRKAKKHTHACVNKKYSVASSSRTKIHEIRDLGAENQNLDIRKLSKVPNGCGFAHTKNLATTEWEPNGQLYVQTSADFRTRDRQL